jgi:TetR/AcrR family transcriptional regulator
MSKAIDATPQKRTRRTQERAEITRSKIVEAATLMFSEQGYDGTLVRDIENAADVHRGLVAYHFGDKASLWKTVIDATFGLMKEDFRKRLEMLQELPEQERLAFIVRFYVRFHARHPELSRLMSQEARQDTWRIRYLIDTQTRPAAEAMRRLATQALNLDDSAFINWYYIMVSASSTIFSFAPECQLLFDVDSREESMVEQHAEMLVSMLLGRAQ